MPDEGIFLLNSPFGLGRDCLGEVLCLKYFNNAMTRNHEFTHRRATYFLITGTNFSPSKILDKKILANDWKFAKFAKIFSLQNTVLQACQVTCIRHVTCPFSSFHRLTYKRWKFSCILTNDLTKLDFLCFWSLKIWLGYFSVFYLVFPKNFES